jgi:hypothetical protein
MRGFLHLADVEAVVAKALAAIAADNALSNKTERVRGGRHYILLSFPLRLVDVCALSEEHFGRFHQRF